MSEHPTDVEEKEEEEGITFFPNHLLKEVIAVYLVIGILITLAVFLPFKLHGKADPLSTPEGIKPEWYFLWVYQALKYFPRHMLIADGKTIGVILIFGVVVFMQFVWPILDNRPERHPRHRKFTMGVVGTALLIGILLMALGVLSERTMEIGGKMYHFDLRGIPHEVSNGHGPPTGELQEGAAAEVSTSNDEVGGSAP